MPRLHVPKTAEGIARFKEARRLATETWRRNKKEGRTKSANPNNSVPQNAQANCDQSANREPTGYQQIADDEADDEADDIADDIADDDIADENANDISDDDSIADVSSCASCEPPNSLCSIDEIIKLARFCDISDSNSSSDSDDIGLSSTESLQASSSSEQDLLGRI